MIASLLILSCMVIIQGAYGTIFPPVSNDPPRPGQYVGSLSPAPSFNSPEDLRQEEGYLPEDEKTNEGRWYYGITQSRESKDDEFFPDEYYYEDREPVIGPVATPRPDTPSSEGYQPSDIWTDYKDTLLGRSTDGRSPTRWVQVQQLTSRVVEEVDPNSGASTDTVKTIAAPLSFNIPPKSQLPANTALNIVQVRLPSVVQLRATYPDSPTVVKNVPVVKQAVSAIAPPPPNVKTVVQQDIITDIQPAAFPPLSSAQISPKNSFVVPAPPPPPLKGLDIPPKVISSGPVNIIPDSNVAISNKNIIPDSSIIPRKSLLQQVRHIWIPTSAETGKFITIPISGAQVSQKATFNKGLSLESTPVTVSDTWILKQDGPVPIFQQQKSSSPPAATPIVQSGKVIFQNPTIVQVEGPANPIVTRIDSPKNAPVVEKTVLAEPSRNIWPARTEITAKVNDFPSEVALDRPSIVIKSDTLVPGKSVVETLPVSQKSIIAETKTALLPQVSSKNVQIENGKPCPLPLPPPQKSVVPTINAGFKPLPRIISNQGKLPVARIIRVNRFPLGNYYMLNRNIRPSYIIYPNQAIIQQPKTGLISLIQTKPSPAYFERKIPLPPAQTKQISIPVLQSKQIIPTVRQVSFPFMARQVILPAASPKTQPIIPAVQPVRYAYPWNAYLSPIHNKGTYIPEFSSFKAESDSDSSSSESSSEEASETSKQKKKQKSKEEKAKKEKSKEEEKVESGESNSAESEKESEVESNSKSVEKESEEETSKKESEESLEKSES